MSTLNSLIRGRVNVSPSTVSRNGQALQSLAAQSGTGTVQDQRTVNIAPGQPQVFNGTGGVPLAPVAKRPLIPITFTLENTGSSTLTFKIGDPTDAVTPERWGVSSFATPVCQNVPYASWVKNFFGSRFLNTQTLNYQSTVSMLQFPSRFIYANFNAFDGSDYGSTNIAPSIANQVRSTDQNTLVRNINFNDYGISPGWDIDSYLIVDVVAGSTATLIFTPFAYSE